MIACSGHGFKADCVLTLPKVVNLREGMGRARNLKDCCALLTGDKTSVIIRTLVLMVGSTMPDIRFIDKVRKLKVHERAVREPSQVRSELTRVFPSLERLLGFLEEVPDGAELDVTRQKSKYILRIRQ